MSRYLKGIPVNRKKSKVRSKFRIMFICSFIAIISFVLIFYISISATIMPSVIEMGTKEATTTINKAINSSVQKVITVENLSTSDLYSATYDDNGDVTSINVNTVVVNEVCSELDAEISKELSEMEPEVIEVPMGVIFGISIFENLGPSFKVKIAPMGNANVDYETKFESVGINQVNFELWLDVSCDAKIVIPLQSETITINRKIPLVNTVFSGSTPDTYMNGVPVSNSVN